MDFGFQLNEPKVLLLLITIPVVIFLGVLGTRARPRDRVRISVSTALRAIILTLVILAVAGLQWVSASDTLNVIFLVDESASVSQQSQDAALNYVENALKTMGPDDRAGVVLFGDRAVVARAVSGGSEWKPSGEHPATTATNIADAIQAGLALFPEGGARRLVLLTDGVETVGAAREQARLVSSSGVQLSVVPLGEQSQNEVAVDRVLSPEEIPAGQQFDVKAVVKSTFDTSATVTLFDNDTAAGRQDVKLKTGDNAVSFTIKPTQEGFHVLSAQVSAADDRYSENNQASSFTMLRKPPTVLIVAGSPADATPLQKALEASQVVAQVVAPDGIPLQEEALSQYDAVVLANASAEAVGIEAQQALQHFVRDLGHGLVMLGGDLSYGAGGYLRSPIEEALPVNMDVRTSEQRASLALAFVTDKSGSMGRCHCGGAQQFNPSMRTEFGVSKVEIAKQAISKAAAILNSGDRVGVLGFDDTAHWFVNMQEMGALSGGRLEQAIKPITAEGNTNIYAGLQAAVDELQQTDAKLKHIILLSDGWTKQGDFSQLLNEMDAQNITLSTVGAGEGASDMLKQLADKGGGRYYPAQDVSAVPDLFLKETVRLIGSYYVEQPFKPILARGSPILKGLDASSLPRLLGYNGATLKPNAELILKSPAGDPVLAQWQYGLGRSVAWTPDVKGRWATDWVSWPKFSQFAGQLVGWTLPRESAPGLEVAFNAQASSIAGEQDVDIRIDSRDQAGAPRNFLSTTVVLTGTSQAGRSESIVQQSPGVYAGVASGLKEGVYQVRVDQNELATHKSVASKTTGLVVPYPSEYRLSAEAVAGAKPLLGDLAQLGGGKELSISQPGQSFTHDISSQPAPVALWPLLLTLALLLFPIDVAVRRLTVTRSDLRTVWRVINRGAR